MGLIRCRQKRGIHIVRDDFLCCFTWWLMSERLAWKHTRVCGRLSSWLGSCKSCTGTLPHHDIWASLRGCLLDNRIVWHQVRQGHRLLKSWNWSEHFSRSCTLVVHIMVLIHVIVGAQLGSWATRLWDGLCLRHRVEEFLVNRLNLAWMVAMVLPLLLLLLLVLHS